MKKIAVDLGYGSVKVCYENSEGVRRYEKFISSVGKVGTSSIIKDANAFEFNSQTYYLFDTALKLPNDQLLDLTSYEGLKEASPIILAFLMNKYGVDYDRIILGLSVAMIEKSADYLNYVSAQLTKPIEAFVLIPQGVGSKIAYDHYNRNPGDPTQYNDTKVKNFLGIDIGFNTIDVYQCIGGVTSGQTIKGFIGEGVARVALNLMDAIRNETGIRISLQHAKEILETGVLVHRGASYDYRGKIDIFIQEYLKGVLELLEKDFSKVIDNMDNLLFVGGGAALLKKYYKSVLDVVDKYYKGDFVIIPEMAEYYNVLGYWLYDEKNFSSSK